MSGTTLKAKSWSGLRTDLDCPVKDENPSVRLTIKNLEVLVFGLGVDKHWTGHFDPEFLQPQAKGAQPVSIKTNQTFSKRIGIQALIVGMPWIHHWTHPFGEREAGESTVRTDLPRP